MIYNQAQIFFIFITTGIVIGMLFDFFRILRKTFNTKDLITYIEDIVFWILTGIIILYTIFTFNDGEIRLYMFIAIILGILTYMILFSKHIIKVNVYIIKISKKIFKKVFYIIFIPINFLYKIVRRVFLKPVSFCIFNIRKFSTNLYKRLTKFPNKIKK